MLLQSIVCVSRRGAGVVKQAEVIGFVDVDVDVSRMLVDRHGDEHGRHMPSSLPTEITTSWRRLYRRLRGSHTSQTRHEGQKERHGKRNQNLIENG